MTYFGWLNNRVVWLVGMKICLLLFLVFPPSAMFHTIFLVHILLTSRVGLFRGETPTKCGVLLEGIEIIAKARPADRHSQRITEPRCYDFILLWPWMLTFWQARWACHAGNSSHSSSWTCSHHQASQTWRYRRIFEQGHRASSTGRCGRICGTFERLVLVRKVQWYLFPA